jgi:exoribonuclease R
MAATYAHATAPLRRLADRYVVDATLAVANGQAVPAATQAAFAALPAVMNKSGARAAQVERAVVDLAETALLAGREGEHFDAQVTDVGENGARIQLCDLPVVARVTARDAPPGTAVKVRLDAADPVRRTLAFTRVA